MITNNRRNSVTKHIKSKTSLTTNCNLDENFAKNVITSKISCSIPPSYRHVLIALN